MGNGKLWPAFGRYGKLRKTDKLHNRFLKCSESFKDSIKTKTFYQKLQIDHPGFGTISISHDQLQNIEWIKRHGESCSRERIWFIHCLEKKAHEMEPLRQKSLARMGSTCRAVLPHSHVPLMEFCGSAVGIEDPAVPRLLETGMPIEGDALDSH